MKLMAAFIFSIGAVICHQLPDRSFFWGEQQFPVCARCTGLYLSALLGAAAWLSVKITRRWRPVRVTQPVVVRALIIASMPTLISVSTEMIGWWDGSNISRAIFAVPLGATAGAIVAAVATKDLR